MDAKALVQAMTPEVYENLRTAVETGKWPDGTPLTEAQKEHSMQAVLMYQAKVLDSDQHMTVNGQGEIVHKSRQQLKQQFQTESDIARFKQDDF